jgi:hypothetical protein
MKSSALQAVDYIAKGKVISIDLIPDDAFTKEQLKHLVARDLNIIFRGPRPTTTDRARALILSKNGTRCVDLATMHVIDGQDPNAASQLGSLEPHRKVLTQISEVPFYNGTPNLNS